MPPKRDQPWLMRTYSGHSSARASNELYRKNLSKGQTGLSVAFDLPTQTGYDSDHVMAKGEVGKVGVPISHIQDMKALFNQIPLDKMNTSMTINATAAWLLALYIATAEDQGADISKLQGTTQNDVIKEYLSRGTYIFPPEHSIRLITDMIAYTVEKIPSWNPTNICSYHLQEAGATPAQEIAYALETAITILDALKRSEKVPVNLFPQVVGRISFFVNAGVRFIEEMCKMRAFARMWDRIALERYGVTDEKYRRLRYGVQVNSLGLTERQPENNITRIILEMLAVVLSKDVRARAVQLPAWNEALGLPRPWDQQWSLRIQQVIACETDLLEYNDIFNGAPVIEEKVGSIIAEAKKEMKKVEGFGGTLKSIDTMKQALVASHAARIRRIETGEQKVVGVNCYPETEPSPLTTGKDEGILKVDPRAERDQIASLQKFRKSRDEKKVQAALKGLVEAARGRQNIMPVSIACAHAGVTTGEWAFALREVFGEYRAPTGVAGQKSANELADEFKKLREKVEAASKKIGGRIRLLVGKPGLDGHSNGAEQIAIRAREAGMEVIYQGIRLTPEEIVKGAVEEGVHLIGLSILSGSHLELLSDITNRMKKAGLKGVPIVVGGIIPESDAAKLKKMGVARVYTPKDFELNRIMSEMVDLV